MVSKYEKYKDAILNWNNTNSDKMKTYLRKSRQKDDARRLLNNAKARANKKGIEFSITKDDIIIPKICPYLKTEFIFGDYNTSMSLDRIDPKIGYTRDNIQVISAKANRMKNTATQEELELFAKHILKLDEDM
jgi:hypothetical protein